MFPGFGALVWFPCSRGWKWMVHITVMSCCSNSCCQTSVKLLASFCFPAHHACAKALRCCDTRLRTSHQRWPPNRPDLSSVDYRLLRVIQECVCQKQQGVSNIVDELWLLTEWYILLTEWMTYYIPQARVEAPIRIGGQLCYNSVANLLQYLYAKKLSKYNAVGHKLLQKIKGCHFFAPLCSMCSWLDTLQVILGTTLRVRWPNQQRHSTEG